MNKESRILVSIIYLLFLIPIFILAIVYSIYMESRMVGMLIYFPLSISLGIYFIFLWLKIKLENLGFLQRKTKKSKNSIILKKRRKLILQLLFLLLFILITIYYYCFIIDNIRTYPSSSYLDRSVWILPLMILLTLDLLFSCIVVSNYLDFANELRKNKSIYEKRELNKIDILLNIRLLREKANNELIIENLTEALDSFKKARALVYSFVKFEKGAKFINDDEGIPSIKDSELSDIYLEIKDSIEKIERLMEENLYKEVKFNLKKANEIQNDNELKESIMKLKNILKATAKLPNTQEYQKLKTQIKNCNDNIILSNIKKKITEGNMYLEKNQVEIAVKSYRNGLSMLGNIFNIKTRENERKKLENKVNQAYINLINSLVLNANTLYNDLDFNGSISKLKQAKTIIKKIDDSDLKTTQYELIKKKKLETRILKIKSTILDLGTKFARLQVIELVEECKEKEDLIITTIMEMIESNEIHAKYFKSSQAVAFNQQEIIDDFDKLRVAINPVIIPEALKMCVVCRGKIKNLLVECSECEALYHLKCAKSLKNKEEGCFQCHANFPPLPELPPEEEQGDPVIISVRKIGYQTSLLLNPDNIQHKNPTAQFLQLKKNLQDELRHKVSSQFHESFKSPIENLYDSISHLNSKNLENLEEIKKEQKKIFADINNKLAKLQDAQDEIRWFNPVTNKKRIFCPDCGNDIIEENQAICEKCGLEL